MQQQPTNTTSTVSYSIFIVCRDFRPIQSVHLRFNSHSKSDDIENFVLVSQKITRCAAITLYDPTCYDTIFNWAAYL